MTGRIRLKCRSGGAQVRLVVGVGSGSGSRKPLRRVPRRKERWSLNNRLREVHIGWVHWSRWPLGQVKVHRIVWRLLGTETRGRVLVMMLLLGLLRTLHGSRSRWRRFLEGWRGFLEGLLGRVVGG